eukprot:TRINITY_DN1170_c0_g1_i1.p1 TRINITY_DN1170_c0_g1~~TRINITY_DN1170_c0_g1_i1.p1  ORF type:complete len:304 (-),score=67.10 TRINITY_DN1170_c0_g1_i1:481-1392(-)
MNIPKQIYAAPKEGQSKHPGKAVIAGGISGAVEILMMYPTEFVKTQMQLQKKADVPKFKSPIHCAQVVVQEKGFFGLYRGLSTLLVGSVPKAAVRFAAFEQFRKSLVGVPELFKGSSNFLAGMMAGITEAIVIVTPMEMVKTRLINDQNSANPKYRGLVNCVSTVTREEGISALYKGLGPTIVKQGSNQAVRFFVFNQIKDYAVSNGHEFGSVKTALAGAVAGAASVAANNPIDVVKTRMQGLEAASYKNSFDCFFSILRKEGPMYFYKGVTPRLARVTGDVAIVFTLYDIITKNLDRVWKTD